MVIDAEDVVGPVCFDITELIPATPAYFYKPVAVGVEAVVAVPGPVHAAGMPSRFRDFFGDRGKRGNPSVMGCHVRLTGLLKCLEQCCSCFHVENYVYRRLICSVGRRRDDDAGNVKVPKLIQNKE